jgi:cellulose synthase/poly-beta-1,6-N-acetylglucosamine synthase-like glycosyltransferase
MSLESRAPARDALSESERPRVSVVIPVRNEQESLPDLLEGLKGQTYPPAEIIIVDGGSSDGSRDLARQITAGDARFCVLAAGEGSPGRNRNLGAEAAQNAWIAFIDAGTRPQPAWLESLVDAACGSGAEVVYGNYEPIEKSLFEQCAALAYAAVKVDRPGGRMRGPSAASMMLRREAWQQAGGFPEMRAAEDLVFFDRIHQGGFKVAWAPRATVWWQLQPTLALTFRRFALYSMSNVWAGRQWDWHHGVARQYAVVALFITLGALHAPWWLAGLPFWLAIRVFWSIWRRREGRGIFWAANPARFAGVALILLTVDLATFVGWIKAGQGRLPDDAGSR